MSVSALKVITYNVHSCVGSDGEYSTGRVAAVLARNTSDICCLQEIEVNDERQRTRVWSVEHASNQPKEIAAILGLEHVCFAPAIRSKAESSICERHHVTDAKGAFGIAILSKYPILETREHRYKPYKKKTLRNAVACLIQLPQDRRVWVVNTHLGCHWGDEQHQQAKELSVFVDSLPKADGVILCGDFNSLPYFSSVKHIVASGLIDAWANAGVGQAGTFPAVGHLLGFPLFVCSPTLRLDYIFCQDIDVDEVFVIVGEKDEHDVLDVIASDHLPVCASFLLSAPN